LVLSDCCVFLVDVPHGRDAELSVFESEAGFRRLAFAMIGERDSGDLVEDLDSFDDGVLGLFDATDWDSEASVCEFDDYLVAVLDGLDLAALARLAWHDSSFVDVFERFEDLGVFVGAYRGHQWLRVRSLVSRLASEGPVRLS
jgi:hypothetical protein